MIIRTSGTAGLSPEVKELRETVRSLEEQLVALYDERSQEQAAPAADEELIAVYELKLQRAGEMIAELQARAGDEGSAPVVVLSEAPEGEQEERFQAEKQRADELAARVAELEEAQDASPTGEADPATAQALAALEVPLRKIILPLAIWICDV